MDESQRDRAGSVRAARPYECVDQNVLCLRPIAQDELGHRLDLVAISLDEPSDRIRVTPTEIFGQLQIGQRISPWWHSPTIRRCPMPARVSPVAKFPRSHAFVHGDG